MIAAVILGVALSSAPASPAQTAPSTPEAAAKPAGDPNKVTCTTEEVTGSRFKKRVCMTAADRERMRQLNEQLDRERNFRSGLAEHSSNAMSGQ